MTDALILRTITALRQRMERLEEEVADLRKRFGVPERGRCPKCRAPIHPAAKACKACGSSWEKPSGLPVP